MLAYSKKASSRCLLALVTLILISVLVTITPSAGAQGNTSAYRQYLSIVVGPVADDAASEAGLALINQVRLEAGVPPVQGRHKLDENCFEHARYMAENNVIGHEQDPSLPYASPAGQLCAERANAWLGSGKLWTPEDSVEDWLASVGHRLWLLYPTTKAIGFGFFQLPGTSRAAAAADVLSYADFAADLAYTGWPVLFPAEGDTAIPPTRFAVTLNWRYGGSNPVLSYTRLVTNGRLLAHEANTSLPVGHKGILILPADPLPPDSEIFVEVGGSYDGQPFQLAWKFRTGGANQLTRSSLSAAVDIR
jgi:uncharacterized protein YkwD